MSSVSSVFSTLRTTFKSWVELSAYLRSSEGGSLRVEEASSSENPFALIRYTKGVSDLTKEHVRAFRSVVWDTIENRPVSVTPFKSEDGESLPQTPSTDGFVVERFVDGVMIGAFYDKYSDTWRVHTRSTLDARSRYYSQTKTFRELFDDSFPREKWSTLNKTSSYTFILQHPENRIVSHVVEPRSTLVQETTIQTDGTVGFLAQSSLVVNSPMATWNDVRMRLNEFNTQFKHNFQGFVVKDTTGKRWKIRTQEYNRVRKMRGNTARRDYMWLSMWSNGTLADYLRLFPEERNLSDNVISRWKRATSDIYHLYTDVFKARTLDRKQIPPKYRPLVYDLHTHYRTVLKPASKTMDWKTTVLFMNDRDIAQMLYVINWETRMAMRQFGTKGIALEPPASAVGTVVETDSDMPDLVPIGPSDVVN